MVQTAKTIVVDYDVWCAMLDADYKLKKKPSTTAELQTTLQKIWNESSEASREGCSELPQAFAGIREQGWMTLRTFHLTHSIPSVHASVIIT